MPQAAQGLRATGTTAGETTSAVGLGRTRRARIGRAYPTLWIKGSRSVMNAIPSVGRSGLLDISWPSFAQRAAKLDPIEALRYE
jgi:hypothetical protein